VKSASSLDRPPRALPVPPAGVLAIVVLIVAPVVTNFVLSLYDYFVGGRPFFIGLENYQRAFGDPRVWNGVRNTFYFTFTAVPLQLLLGIGIAVLFNREFPGKGLARTIILLPMVATPVAIALIWALMFNPSLGVLNYFLESLGPAALAVGGAVEPRHPVAGAGRHLAVVADDRADPARGHAGRADRSTTRPPASTAPAAGSRSGTSPSPASARPSWSR
jgi:ABC-type sugar transport system permease subunit